MLFHVPFRLYVFNLYFHQVETTSSVNRGVFRGRAMGAKPPQDSEIYWFQGIFRPQHVLSPPPRKEKNKFPLNNFLNTPLSVNYLFEELLTLCYPRLWGVKTFSILVTNWSGIDNIYLQTQIHIYNSSLCFKNKT